MEKSVIQVGIFIRGLEHPDVIEIAVEGDGPTVAEKMSVVVNSIASAPKDGWVRVGDYLVSAADVIKVVTQVIPHDVSQTVTQEKEN